MSLAAMRTGAVLDGRFVLRSLLGQGQQGAVWAVDDLRGDAPAVVKLGLRAEVLHEAAILLRVSHPVLPRVLALGLVPGGGAFVALERVDGEALAVGAPVAQVVAAGARVADALGHLHALGLVHGDIKPAHLRVGPAGVRLLDLGLAGQTGHTLDPAGSLAFLAPEALAGERSAAGDLYALAVSLTLCLTGQHPQVDDLDDRRALLDAAVASRPPREAVLQRLPAGLRTALERALHPTAALRASNALAWRAGWVRDAVEAGLVAATDIAPDLGPGGAAGGLPDAPPWVGDPGVVARAVAALEAAWEGKGLGVMWVGPQGSGRGRLVEDTLRALRVRAAGRGAAVTVTDDVTTALDGPAVLTGYDLAPEALTGLAETAVRLRGLVGSTVALCVTTTGARSAEGWTRLEIGALDDAGLGALFGHLGSAPLPPVALARWREGTGALPGRVVQAVRALGLGRLATASVQEVEAAARPVGMAAPEGLSPSARALLATLLAAAEPLPLQALLHGDDPLAPLQELRARGLLLGDAEAVRPALSCVLPVEPAVLQDAYHRLALALPGRAQALARVAQAAGLDAMARHHWRAVSSGDASPTPTHAERARAACEADPDDPEARLFEAEQWLRAGDPERCLAAAARARVSPRRAWVSILALRRANRRDEASALARSMAQSPEVATSLRGTLALTRDALDRGDLASARALLPLDATLASADDDTRATWEELSSLVSLGLDDPAAAEGFARSMERRCRRMGDDDTRARALSILGMIAQRRGDPSKARRCYHDAWSLAVEAGDAHGAATYLINLGGAAFDAGDLGEALRALQDASPALAARGRLPELTRALVNLASLRAWIGDRVTARELAQRAARAARSLGDRLAEGCAEAISAECSADRNEALEGLAASATRLDALGDARRSAETWARMAKRALEGGDLVRAQTALDRARGVCSERVSLRSVAALALTLRSTPGTASDRGVAQHEADEALREDPSAEAALWRSALQITAALGTNDRPEAARRWALHQGRVESLAASLPDAEAGLFREAHGLPPPEALRPAQEATGDATAWRRLVSITRELHAEPRLDALLERIMDAVIELTGGRRGFLLLRGEDGALRVRTARNVARHDVQRDEMAFSRSIAEEVARTGQRVVSLDAQGERAVGGAESVAALQLRSVLAVPLRLPGEVMGTVYVDDRFRVGAFGDEAAEVAQAFADAAALALDNARQRRALERALRRTERLSAELAHTVASQQAELALARQTTPDATRGHYEALIGRGAAMRQMLALLDRVAPTPMPVLLQGESGTGKELVARALHANSPRASRPFVAENCSAIPETLLESVLFGHTRGAFTGADRSRPGLFEVADGGTLFLDEVGEMSPAMQARLLRVLQEGEVRPVGGDRARKVDVRVVAATHRDLAEMVRRGTFREDLFYRLAVVVVVIPPLRDRREDIPALVAHFLDARTPPVSIDRRALTRLVEAPWPGNIRQLQNELARAAVLADGIIRVEDLSAAFLADRGTTPETSDADPADALHLRRAVGSIERDLVERALRSHGGNQSRAARDLGLSRFGLQKKLKRLGIDPRNLDRAKAS